MRRFAFAMALALATFASPGTTFAQSRSNLTIGISQFPPNLHPSIDSNISKFYFLAVARRGLTYFDAEWKLACELCTEVPSLQNGRAKLEERPEGKGIAATFTLKPGLKWADGVPITTKDVAFSVDLALRAEAGFSNSDFTANVDKVVILDEASFVIHYKTVRYDFDQAGFAILPGHIEGPIYRALADPKDYGRNSAYNRAPGTPGLYNGPYRIAQVEIGQFVRFERNEFWAGEKPAFDRITIRTIENTSVLEQNLLSGDIDYVAGELGLTLDQLLALQKRAPDKFTYLIKPRLSYERILLNLDNPALADKRVRQALLMALDRETIVRRLFEGNQTVAHSWAPPNDATYDPDVKRYRFDPAAAKKLLDEAGFKPGAGGIRQNAAGLKLSFEFATTAGNKVRELVQQVAQSQFKDIGVEVVIKNDPPRTFFGQTLKERRFTGLAALTTLFSPESQPIRILRSDSIPTQANGFAGGNFGGFNNAEMDRLIDAVSAELDPAVRKGYWKRMNAIYAEELPSLPLYFGADAFAIPKWLSGVNPPGHGAPTTKWIEHWRANQ